MKKVITVILMVLTFVVMADLANAQGARIWTAADAAPAFAIRYLGSGAATLTVTAEGVTASDAGTTNAYLYSADASPTMGELVADMQATTNASGVKNFEAKLLCALAADTITNSHILVASAVTVTREWYSGPKWDVSNCKHYDVLANRLVDSRFQRATIDSIDGLPTGTGNITVTAYVNGNVKWQDVILSPQYVKAETNATNVSNEVIHYAYPGITIPTGGAVGFVRAARATTATTGGIGLSTTGR